MLAFGKYVPHLAAAAVVVGGALLSVTKAHPYKAQAVDNAVESSKDDEMERTDWEYQCTRLTCYDHRACWTPGLGPIETEIIHSYYTRR